VDKERYDNLRNIVVVAIGFVVAIGAARNSWALPILAVLLGIIALFTLRRQVSEVLHDERIVVIQQKAASRTLGYVTATTGLLGLVLIEMSYRGFSNYRIVGYAFVYLAYVIMMVYALFTWYYQRQMGG
jgi:uncharacterized membrane protein